MLKFLHRSNDTKKAPEVAVTLEPHTKKTPEVTVTLEPPSPSLESVSRPPSPGIVHVDDGSTDARGPLGLNLLHAPSEPLFDFVFVHGLGGGSRKTWSKTTSASHYWPADWLPKDPAFRNVRIHSFGYDSDWTKDDPECLNVHHIGNLLFEGLSASPHISESSTALVLIGHSTGGVVIKKAYMLARQTDLPLAQRIRALYFLATPHRSCNSEELLKNILQVASSTSSSVTKSVHASGSLHSVNKEFRHYADGVELRSFYETRKLKTGLRKTLILDPDLAILGYNGEKQMPVNEDHNSICKFDSPFDHTYTIIRNSLAATISDITTADSRAAAVLYHDSIEAMRSYLEVADETNDLYTVQDARVPETCEWILEKQSYADWKDLQQDVAPVLWLSGRPGTGKSVLAGFVVDDLQQLSGAACSYHFFKRRGGSKPRLNACLRSLAFQMASADSGVRDMLMRRQADGLRLDLHGEDAQALWRDLFVFGVFQATTIPHFWVIDALDACSDLAPFLGSMLSETATTSVQLRILITSRETPDLCRLFAGLGPHWHKQERISAEDTLPDIERVVAGKGEMFFTDGADSRAALERRVVKKSKGSFSWTVRALDELSMAFTHQEIERVLEEVPREMDDVEAVRESLQSVDLAGSRSQSRGLPVSGTKETFQVSVEQLEVPEHQRNESSQGTYKAPYLRYL